MKKFTEMNHQEQLLYQFFYGIIGNHPIKALDLLIRKKAYGYEAEGVVFRNSYDPWDEEYNQMTDRHVMLNFYKPAYLEDEQIMLTFEEFYRYVEDAVHAKTMRVDPGNPIYDEKLAELKKALDLDGL